jgi:dihydroflavonol-4-reductase
MPIASDTVLVRDATGFVAQHCVLELLRSAYRVRGTVRCLSTAARVRETLSRHTSIDGRLELGAT